MILFLNTSLTLIELHAIQGRTAHPDRQHGGSILRIDHHQMSFRAAGSKCRTVRMERQGNDLVTDGRCPDQFVAPPQRYVLIVTTGRKHFVIRMGCQGPQLFAMAEDNLIETALQRAFQDVVSRRSHVDVSIVSAGSLRVDGSYATGRLG